MQIRPLHDRVIIKRLESERTTASGIVIPDNAAEKPDQGEVVAVGPGRRDEAGKLSPSRLTARNSSSCAKKTSWAFLPDFKKNFWRLTNGC